MGHGRWMIYGANGYTGRLIARQASTRGLKLMLAGRNGGALRQISDETGYPARLFSLTASPQTIAQHHLSDIDGVLNCAGPFSETAMPMAKACLYAGIHYLDITGELSVFEELHGLHREARKKKTVICAGVGFDVVPTDCVAATLKEKLPDANKLALAFKTKGGISAGTAKTGVEIFRKGGKIRQMSNLVNVPLGKITRKISFHGKEVDASCFPLADLATAYRTTNIPNIETFIPLSKDKNDKLRYLQYARYLLAFPPLENLIKNKVGQRQGPSPADRAQSKAEIWGEAENAQGKKVIVEMTTADPYDVTVESALGVMEYLKEFTVTQGGYYTPAKLMGANFICALPGSSEMTIKTA